MKLYDVKEKDIIEISALNLSKKTLDRFESLNIKKGKKFIIKEIKKEKYIKLQYYDKDDRVQKSQKAFVVISKYYFDKVDIIKITEG